MPAQKFEKYAIGHPKHDKLNKKEYTKTSFLYTIEVYVDEFISLVIPVIMAVMTGMYNEFPSDSNNDNDPISNKKVKQEEKKYSTQKHFLGLILMERMRPCGFKQKNRRSY